MNVKKHMIIGIAFSIVLWELTGNAIWVVLLFLTMSFIDIDHLFYYAVKERKISLRGCHDYFNTRCYMKKAGHEIMTIPLVFHSVEFLGLLLILYLFIGHPYVIIVFFGVIFHLIFDLIRDKKVVKRFRRVRLIR